jgi:membrane associated rhomboid family serine protease
MFSRTYRPSWVFVLILLNIVVFLFEPKINGLFLNPQHPLAQTFEFIPSMAFERPWTFISSIFMHADLSHLFFNMFALFIFGSYLESRVGAGTFLFVYFLAGIFGNFGYMLTAFNPNIPGVGASGAIYGLIGTLAAVAPLAIVYMGFAPMPMIFVAVLYGITEFFGLFVPSGIARGAHLGGLIVGFLYGLYLRNGMRRYR